MTLGKSPAPSNQHKNTENLYCLEEHSRVHSQLTVGDFHNVEETVRNSLTSRETGNVTFLRRKVSKVTRTEINHRYCLHLDAPQQLCTHGWNSREVIGPLG